VKQAAITWTIAVLFITIKLRLRAIPLHAQDAPRSGNGRLIAQDWYFHR
jgi:hypothetical protein